MYVFSIAFSLGFIITDDIVTEKKKMIMHRRNIDKCA